MRKILLLLPVLLIFSGCNKPEKKPRGVNLSGYEQHQAQKPTHQQHAAQSITKLGAIATGDSSGSVVKRKRRILK